MVDKEKNIEENELSLDLMRFRYKSEEIRNNEIDNKISTLIAFLGVIMSLQGTLGSILLGYCEFHYSTELIIVSVLFIFSLICYTISIIILIDSYNPKEFLSAPNHDSISFYKEKNYEKNEIITDTINDMITSMEHNETVMDNKSDGITKALSYFKKGLILTIIFITIFILFKISVM